MVDGGACTHPVGACPSDSAGAELGSLNAADPPMPEPHEDLVELDALDLDHDLADIDHEIGVLVALVAAKAEVAYYDKEARCVSFSAANLMHAAGDPAAAAAIAKDAPKGLLLKQLAARIKDTQVEKGLKWRRMEALRWTAQKPNTFGYDQNSDPNLVRFLDWLLDQTKGLFVVSLMDERKLADHAIGVDCGERLIYNPARRDTLPLSMDSLSECVPGGRKLIGIKEARKLVRL